MCIRDKYVGLYSKMACIYFCVRPRMDAFSTRNPSLIVYHRGMLYYTHVCYVISTRGMTPCCVESSRLVSCLPPLYSGKVTLPIHTHYTVYILECIQQAGCKGFLNSKTR